MAYPFFEHADSAQPRNPSKETRLSFRAGARESLGTRLEASSLSAVAPENIGNVTTHPSAWPDGPVVKENSICKMGQGSIERSCPAVQGPFVSLARILSSTHEAVASPERILHARARRVGLAAPLRSSPTCQLACHTTGKPVPLYEIPANSPVRETEAVVVKTSVGVMVGDVEAGIGSSEPVWDLAVARASTMWSIQINCSGVKGAASSVSSEVIRAGLGC